MAVTGDDEDRGKQVYFGDVRVCRGVLVKYFQNRASGRGYHWTGSVRDEFDLRTVYRVSKTICWSSQQANAASGLTGLALSIGIIAKKSGICTKLLL